MCAQDGVVNTYLAKVASLLPPQLQDRTHLFTTFFITKLLGPIEPELQSSVAQLMQSIQYMNVRRYGIQSGWRCARYGFRHIRCIGFAICRRTCAQSL